MYKYINPTKRRHGSNPNVLQINLGLISAVILLRAGDVKN